MKIASSSVSFDRALRAGDLTQLEWLDLCATTLALEGVVFEAAHFPRTDDDYLAQLKKMAVDLGLTVAAVAADALLEPDGLHWIEIAAQLGAPLVVARAPRAADDFTAWNDVAATARLVASAAKRANVTVAVRNAPGTLCENVGDLKRFAKDTDSAWIRYALDPAQLSPSDPSEPVLPRTVITFCDVHVGDADETASNGTDAALASALRGFLVVNALGERATLADLVDAIAHTRAALAATAAAAI